MKIWVMSLNLCADTISYLNIIKGHNFVKLFRSLSLHIV